MRSITRASMGSVEPLAKPEATRLGGGGIDKCDLRFVIHWDFPTRSRAITRRPGGLGATGSPRVALLYRLEDRQIQAYFLGGR